MLKIYLLLAILIIPFGMMAQTGKNMDETLLRQIHENEYFPFVKSKAAEIMKTGFNAGDGYREVWIRDYNTFIELASNVFDKEVLKENLLIFFRMQGKDGNIIDGFTPIEKVKKTPTSVFDYAYIFSALEPRYAGHKNTVETDQESSLVQSVYKYIRFTGDTSILQERVGERTVGERMDAAMEFLINERFNKQYGLIVGATTADWGDVQPEHEWGTYINEHTHPAIDIYDNAMFVIALNDLMKMLPELQTKWNTVKKRIEKNVRKHLWDKKEKKFIPHIYLKGSPFPSDFNENKIFYFGGTAIAVEAGLLSKREIKESLEEMVKRMKLAGAATIGLTLYPPYPNGFFANKGMGEFSYQNGGDWTWFGGRMIQQLIHYGFIKEAYEQIQPMVKRVKDNNGFYEWYTVDNKPRGSGTFRGEAGVLYTAIRMFDNLK